MVVFLVTITVFRKTENQCLPWHFYVLDTYNYTYHYGELQSSLQVTLG
jgi:hypothetical protein